MKLYYFEENETLKSIIIDETCAKGKTISYKLNGKSYDLFLSAADMTGILLIGSAVYSLHEDGTNHMVTVFNSEEGAMQALNLYKTQPSPTDYMKNYTKIVTYIDGHKFVNEPTLEGIIDAYSYDEQLELQRAPMTATHVVYGKGGYTTELNEVLLNVETLLELDYEFNKRLHIERNKHVDNQADNVKQIMDLIDSIAYIHVNYFTKQGRKFEGAKHRASVFHDERMLLKTVIENALLNDNSQEQKTIAKKLKDDEITKKELVIVTKDSEIIQFNDIKALVNGFGYDLLSMLDVTQ